MHVHAKVSGDAATRTAASEAKKALKQMWARAYANPELYARLQIAADESPTIDAEESQLVKSVLARFHQCGTNTHRSLTSALICVKDN
jgi:Zn-dependent oligopeptidase